MNKFSYDSSKYTHYRPQYPDGLFEYLRTLLDDKKGLVLDCGAGSGQGTQGLSRYFAYVIATDLSFELLAQAPSLQNVLYVQSSAEHLAIRSRSLSLICVAQALHWFSLDNFYGEAKRVLKSNGVIAAWCYNQAIIEPSIDQVIRKVYQKMSSAQNPSQERQYLYEHYQTILFPFKRIITPFFNIEMSWNLIQLLGYISTWPSLLEFQKRFGVNLLNEVKEELFSAWGDPICQKQITWPLNLLVGRLV